MTRTADSGTDCIQLAMGEVLTHQIHASHFQTMPWCFTDDHGIEDPHQEQQLFELKVIV